MPDPEPHPEVGQDTPAEAPQSMVIIAADKTTEADKNNDALDEKQPAAVKPKPKRAASKPKPLVNPNATAPGDVRFPAELPENLVNMFLEWMYANGSNIIPLDIYFMQSPWVFKVHDASSTKKATDAGYFHATTGEKLDVRMFSLPWMTTEPTGRNSQRLLVAFNHHFPEPVILYRLRRGCNDFRIWRGVGDNPSERTTIVKRAIGPKNKGARGVQRVTPGFAGPSVAPQLNSPVVPNFTMPNIGYPTNAIHDATINNHTSSSPAVSNTGIHNVSMASAIMRAPASFNVAMFTAPTSTSTVPITAGGNTAEHNILDFNATELNAAVFNAVEINAPEGDAATPNPSRSSNDSPTTRKRKRSSSSMSSNYPELDENNEGEKEVLSNVVASIKNLETQPAAVINPPTPTLRELANKVAFRFYGLQNQVRVRGLFHTDSFEKLVTHAVAGGLFSEFDQIRILVCEWSVLHGIPRHKMVVDEQDWQELMQELVTDPGWTNTQAVCVIHVSKKIW